MKETTTKAQLFEKTIQRHREYADVTVRALRGYLYIYAGDETPVVRLTPTRSNEYAIHFHSHSGRWELVPMPLVGEIPEAAETVLDMLGPYLQNLN
jgi:hypothetical protein